MRDDYNRRQANPGWAGRDPRYQNVTPGDRARYGEGPNFGSARTDYGNRAYGGRLDNRGMEDDRGLIDRATDEVKSWFGDEDAERRRRRDERIDERDDRNDRQMRASRGDYGPRGREYGAIPDRDYDRQRFAGRDVRPDDRTAYRRGREAGMRRGPLERIMTEDVSTVRPEDSVQHAARIMRDEDCGALPVVDRYGRAVGMITDRDITCRIVADGRDLRRARISEAMTGDIFACSIDSSVEDVMRVMSQHQVRRIPITDERDRVVGIVSQGDLARFLDDNRGPRKERFTDVVSEISEPTGSAYQ
jgi:CBS domain-containing protein